MLTRLLATAALGAALAATAAPVHAATPLFADTWKAKMQSEVLEGNAGRRTTYLSFERPRIMNFTAYRVRGIKKLRMRLSRGWLTASYRVRKHCYTAKYVYRLKATRVLDMEGEPVASRARLRHFNAWRSCSGDSFRSWFEGTAVRESPPQKGPADISYDSPDGCDPTLVHHSASEDVGFFYEWGDTLSYHWTFSDGGTSTEARPRHRYPGPGTHSATVVMRELNGSVAKSTAAVEIPEPEACN